ncbi:diacylglycerol/lipid kinase family protein [Fibrobacterota bacterium]
MKKYSIAFLINPVSGGGLGARVFSQLPEIMASFGYSQTDWIAYLTKETSLMDQIRSSVQISRKIIAVGGDGTIGQILNQLRLHHCDAEVGLIPLGTGNDLGRSLGIYRVFTQKGLLACIKRLLKANSTEFDLWSVNRDSTMATYLSIGMDAAILHDFDQARKKGMLAKSALINKMYYVLRFFFSIVL